MITAKLVKELRDKTGAGMMDCKKILTETQGDIDKAVEVLRKKGLETVAKKADRVASEGSIEIYISDDEKSAGIIELNCETDFTAANEEFTTTAKNLAKQAAKSNASDINQFISEKYIADENITIKDRVIALIAKFGENMTLKRFDRFEVTDDMIKSYIHDGGRIGVIVQFSCAKEGSALQEAAKNIAMQVAAIKPLFLDRSVIKDEVLIEKRENFKSKALNEGKPVRIVDKIVEGKIDKFLKDACLYEQVWIKDSDYTIEQYLDEKSKEIGEKVSIVRFVRFERGEE